MPSRLSRLLRPRSIAVIGGGAWCRSVIQQCRKIGFDGPIWPVHPKQDEIHGLGAYRSVSDLPEPPDAAFVGVNRLTTIGIVRELSALGAGGAVCFASGFGEAQANDSNAACLQRDLLAAAGEMALLGPNCYGFLNYLDRALLWPDQHGGRPLDSGVAILSQSSNIALNLTMQARGLPIAYVVTVGNQAQQSIARIGEEVLRDERVTALGLYVEGFGSLQDLTALADTAARLNKPVVALKLGRSKEARAATVSHTASLAGEDAGAQALMERLGIARVASLGEFLESLKLLHVHGRLKGNRIASLSCSGGEAGLVADAGHMKGVTFPVLGEDRKKTLASVLGPLVALANPLDYHTGIWRDLEAMTSTFAAMTGPDIDLTMVILDVPRADRCDPIDWDEALTAIEQAAGRSGAKLALVASLPETLPEAVAERMMSKGIAPLCGLEDALAAVRAAGAMLAEPCLEPPLVASAPAAVQTLSERESKEALSAFGIGLPRMMTAASPETAAANATSLGFPVVLKGEGIAHKSERAAVVVNLQDAASVEQAAMEMPAESFLVESMVGNGVAELLVGVVHDEAHGYVLTLAAGGVLTEILGDRQSLLVPATREMVSRALARLNIAPLLQGFRGKPPADQQAIIDSVMALQDYVIANAGRIREVEVNPLICTPSTAIAVDALITIEA